MFAVIEIKLIYNSLFYVMHVSVDGVKRFRRVKYWLSGHVNQLQTQ